MRTPLLALSALALLAACDANDGDGGVTATLRADQVAADTLVMVNNRPLPKTNRYTLYSLRDNAVVLSYKEASAARRAADSLSLKWDIGFSSENIIVNRTPGSLGAALLVTSAFEALTAAPATGYATTAKVPGSILDGTGVWTYTAKTDAATGARWGTLTPTPGRTLVLRTADGDYAKLKFVSYYKGVPDLSAVTIRTTMNFVTFDYVLQRDGTTSFQ